MKVQNRIRATRFGTNLFEQTGSSAYQRFTPPLAANTNINECNSGVYRNFFGFGGNYARIFFGVVQQIQLRTEGRDDGDLGAVAP
jgi:hypothetical protein